MILYLICFQQLNEMTTVFVRSHHPNPHDRQFDPSSPELDHQTSSSSTEEADERISLAEEHSAEFIAECQRQGLPLDTAKRIQRRNQRFEDKWWRDMQIAVGSSSDTKENDAGERLKMPSTEEILARGTSTKDITEVGGEGSIQKSLQSPALTEDAIASAKQLLRQTKAEALEAIRSTHGDTSNPRFVAALKSLTSLYRGMKNQPGAKQDVSSDFEGQWTMLSRPNFRDGLGQNRRGDFVYTLGRMAFGMFRPTELRCSIQRILNTTTFVGPDDDLPESVPRTLRKEIQDLRDAIRQSGTTDVTADGSQAPILRTYDIEVEFSIEPKDEDDVITSKGRRLSSASSSDSLSSHSSEHSYSAPSKPLRAKMITNGYLLPDPKDKDRLTVWFTGGTIVPVRETGEEEAEKRKRKKKATKKKHSNKDKTEGGQSLSSIKESVCDRCENSCPLLLHECRRENKQCPLHGQKKLSREYRHKMKARVQKYVRPKSYGIYVPHKTGLSVGDMVDAPFDSEWEDIFATEATWKNKSWGESAKLLAAKMLLGADLPDRMEDDGSMSYSLHRPIGGHGTTFVDVLYLDEDLRITRGNAGSVFVQVKQKHKPSCRPAPSVTTTPKPEVQAGRHKKATAA